MPWAGTFDILTDWIFRLSIGGNYVKTYEDDIGTCDLTIRTRCVAQCSLHELDLGYGAWGGVVVKALRYWSDGLGIDSR